MKKVLKERPFIKSSFHSVFVLYGGIISAIMIKKYVCLLVLKVPLRKIHT